jgi:uncharacterized protein
MIDLPAAQLRLVQEILKKWAPDAKIYIFGSRVKGNAKPFSDLDVAIENNPPLNPHAMAELKNDFSESSLPIKIDVVDWGSIDENFKKLILADCVQL